MEWSTLLMVALMGGAFYFLLIRPQKKRAKEQQEALAAMQAGSRVMTISGIIGTISHIGEKQAILEIAPGVEITIDKRALSTQPIEDEFEYVDADADADAAELESAVEPDQIESQTADSLTFDPTPPVTETEEDRKN